MRFITEIDLRNEFRQKSFKTYEVNTSDRLTSDAKQFLEDRNITIIKDIDKEIIEISAQESRNKSCVLGSQLLYAEILEIILIAKDNYTILSEELYSMSLVIKQFSELDFEQEIQLHYPNHIEEQQQVTVTLKNLFSDDGHLIVKLFKLDVNIKSFNESYVQFLSAKQINQLEVISSRLLFLTAQLIGE